MHRILLCLPLLLCPAAASAQLSEMAAPKPPRAVDLPDGFAQQVVADGLTGATGLAVLPDGRILVTEQTGTLRVVRDDRLLPEPALTLTNLDSLWERGLIGVEVDPHFADNGFVYLLYVAADPFPHHRLARFTMAGDRVDPGSETLLLGGDDQRTLGGGVPAGHQGGGVRFGADGMLYAAVGEQTAGSPSQRLDTFQGKVLRVAPDGTIPADNPFFAAADGKYRAIYARGLRNPFALSVGPDDAMWVTDVGGSKWEEINRLVPGGNYGWPRAEGFSADPGLVNPVHAYADGGAKSISAGLWAGPPDARRYYFADYMQNWVRFVEPGVLETAGPFAANLTGPVALAEEAEGALLILCRNAWVKDGGFRPNTGVVHRVFDPAATARPAPRITRHAADLTVADGDAATFTVAADGENLSHRWERDGEELRGAAGPTLGLPRVTVADDGAAFRCVVGGGADVDEAGGGRTLVAGRTARLRVEPYRGSAKEFAGPRFDAPADGLYRFTLASPASGSDTGAKLLVAGKEVASLGPFGGRTADGAVALRAGPHPVLFVGADATVAATGPDGAAVSFAVAPVDADAVGPTGRPVNLTAHVPADPADLPPRLSQLGLFADLSTLEPAAGVVPYSVASPLWSDGAAKRRWVVLPGESAVGFDPAEPWSFPAGTVFVKHFEVGTPPRRLETRVMRADGDGSGWGATYRWGDDPAEAALVPAAGSTETVNFSADGRASSLPWTYPSRTDCLRCHTANAGFTLGVVARQLHGPLDHASPGDFFADAAGGGRRQLDRWRDAGLFDVPPSDAALAAAPRLADPHDASADLGRRARSYLDANCAMCHRPGGARGAFDLRATTPPAESGLIGATPYSADLGVEGAAAVVPGVPTKSTVSLRMHRRGGPFAMPPLATAVPDAAALAVVDAWIKSLAVPHLSVPPGDEGRGARDEGDDERSRRSPEIEDVASTPVRRPSSPAGKFFAVHEYTPGPENPKPNDRFRVNSPEASLHPEHGGRSEVRGNGMLQIDFPHDPRTLAGVRLAVDLWAGHPGTTNRRVTLNGRSTYPLPGPPGGRCGHAHPVLDLKRTDVVNGWNSVQFACDDGDSFWGHFIVDRAALLAELPPGHDVLRDAGLTDFRVRSIMAGFRGKPEMLLLLSEIPAGFRDRVESVTYTARYRGYDEDGSGDGSAVEDGWHGFVKDGEPVGAVGTAAVAPFAVEWDRSMLPARADVAVRATVRFSPRAPDAPPFVYVSPDLPAPPVREREDATVTIHPAADMPEPFWSRADEPESCTVTLPDDFDPAAVERAELHVVIWDGGSGSTKHPVTLNGTPLPVVGGGNHDTLYRVVALDPAALRPGANEFTVRADTTHHGIEVLSPGPAIVVRTRR